jgi:hypothetical protein|tara:strand:- start:1588 stop:2181 length:594 start_codon:yes stop_codon:yes gene_type:complete
MILIRKYIIYILIIIAIAAIFTYVSIPIYKNITFTKNDIWTVSASPGDPKRSIYTRAYVSVNGLLALSKPESAYFSADRDIEDITLNGSTCYLMSGHDIQSASVSPRWWSITVYGKDGYLIESTEKQYSYNSENIIYDPSGKFEIYLNNMPSSKVANWLKTPIEEVFSVVLRVYQPGEEFFSNLKRVDLPIIEKVEC